MKSSKPYNNLYQVNEELEVILTDITEKNVYLIEGIPCTSILEEYKWKREKNRLKDQKIIEKLEKLLEEISEHYQCSRDELMEQQVEQYIKKLNITHH